MNANKKTTHFDMERGDNYGNNMKTFVDNSKRMLYNDNEGIGTGFTSQIWKSKNNELLKYIGDDTKKSIDKGLLEAKDFISDAYDEADLEKIYDASVKWRLAADSQNDELCTSARNEMIGHLSEENKNLYLKSARPISEFIDSKENYDYKSGNYITTGNVNTVPSKHIRSIQSNLNDMGYRDKFGDKLKEDGILAAKTQFAYDSYIYDKLQMAGVLDKSANKFYDLVPASVVMDNSNGEIEYSIQDNSTNSFVSIVGNEGVGLLKSMGYTRPQLSDNGNISNGDKAYSYNKKTLIRCLSSLWKKNKNDEYSQNVIHDCAETLRNMNDDSFDRAVFLNCSDGAANLGHSAVMLVDSSGYGTIFSFYPTLNGVGALVSNPAEMRLASLMPEKVNDVLSENGNPIKMVATDGAIVYEYYDRVHEFKISKENGKSMFGYSISLYNDPMTYNILLRNCDHIVVNVFESGGINIRKHLFPNNTFKDIK